MEEKCAEMASLFHQLTPVLSPNVLPRGYTHLARLEGFCEDEENKLQLEKLIDKYRDQQSNCKACGEKTKALHLNCSYSLDLLAKTIQLSKLEVSEQIVVEGLSFCVKIAQH